jgi:hypothetical protein
MAVTKQYTSVNDYPCDLNIDAANVDKPIVTVLKVNDTHIHYGAPTMHHTKAHVMIVNSDESVAKEQGRLNTIHIDYYLEWNKD